MNNVPILMIIAMVVAMGAWLAVLAFVIRQIVRDTGDSPLSRILWVLIVIFMPILGPVIWSFVRWQVPSYGKLFQQIS